MLLAIDIGNSSIKTGIYDDQMLVSRWSIPTRRDLAADDLDAGISRDPDKPITDAVICSVVPEAESPVREFLTRLGVDDPLFVTNDIDFGLRVSYEPVSAIGTDRLVNSFSAAEKYGVPCIVCSFGTALTVDVVDKDRALLGGIIAPGAGVMAKALHLYTAQLPDVEIKEPLSVIGNTTEASIRSGIFYGYISMASGLVRRIQNESGDNPQVIATGGFASLIAEHTDQIDIVDENLLLDGLLRLHSRIAR